MSGNDMDESERIDSGRRDGNDNPIKSIEALLRRVQVLQGACNAVQKDLATSYPLLAFPALQTRLSQIQQELTECNRASEGHMQIMSTTVVLPTHTFPAKYHMPILDGLFRTKQEPSTEEWQEQALKTAIEQENRMDREKRDGRMTTLSDKDRHELWQWAAVAADNEARQYPWFDADYTLDEVRQGIENVRHGLKRHLRVPEPVDSDEDDDDDDDDDAKDDSNDQAANPGVDEMEVDSAPAPAPAAQRPALAKSTVSTQPSQLTGVQPMPLDNVLRFMTKTQLR